MPQLDTTYYFSSVYWFFLCFGVIFLFSQFWLIPKLRKLFLKREMVIATKLNEIKILRQEVMDLNTQFKMQLQKTKEEAKANQVKAVESFNDDAQRLLHKIGLECDQFIANEEQKLEKECLLFLKNKDQIVSSLVQVFMKKYNKASKVIQPLNH